MGARSAVVISVLLAGCTAVFGIDKTELDPAPGSPRTLVFDNLESTTDLVGIPVAVVLDPTRIEYDLVADPRTNLRFHDPDDDVDLPFEIEQWQPGDVSIVWVRVPTIDAHSARDSILMYYGAEAAGTESPTDVWQDYELVLHGKPGEFASSTANGYTGIASGITNVSGKLGSGIQLVGDGTEHSVELPGPLFDGWPSYSLDMWLYLDYESSAGYASSSGGEEPSILSEVYEQPGDSASATGGRLYNLNLPDSLFAVQIDMQYLAGTVFDHPLVRLKRWVNLVWTFDGATQWTYRDGEFETVTEFESPTQMLPSPGPLLLGGKGVTMNGIMDEVRVSRTAHSADWTLAQYLMETGRFITFVRPDELP